MTSNQDSKHLLQDDTRLRALSNALTLVASEPVVLAQYELTARHEFAQLWPDDHRAAFDARVNNVVEHLGGPPPFYVVKDGKKPPPSDKYPEAAMSELFAVFSRARNSVLRAHIFNAGSLMLAQNPDLLETPQDPASRQLLVAQTQHAFWEHAEAAYIRLYSYWDRVGQVLDFAFFNIRKFDQNGFNSVMDRIHANAVPMDDQLKSSRSWKQLRDFQNSNKEDGLKWLLQRRNLVVHSLHLHPLPEDEDSVFTSQFNHLEKAHREKLRPRAPAEEVRLLVNQLNKAGELFESVLRVVLLSPSRRRDCFIR
ncbi:Cthe_2314 family HEPN domain-containing protein [Rubrivivax gelatinosus]|uniref:Cthe_2314 family HEPN domain-containing protein n=1 Tax=Rubrivivax gelatinosus TaxID=28068 RepID=UPI0012FDBFD6|nr:Cthe_2314 family HEPN domain-containing protein [Rubrivivax gelatinosus]MBG6078887.1 hypothetical protein [Rubrivivax gelatinosus]